MLAPITVTFRKRERVIEREYRLSLAAAADKAIGTGRHPSKAASGLLRANYDALSINQCFFALVCHFRLIKM